jgi:hypothetical protein
MNRTLKSLGFVLFLSAVLLPAGIICQPTKMDKSMMSMKPMNPQQAAFQDAMRKLWEDHITWTRLFIVSTAAGLPDNEATTNRLLQNQVDIGNAIKPYYGGPAGDQLTALLKDHIVIAADLVKAAKANNTAAVTSANTRWIANADQISAFLSKANPKNWPEADMRQMMHDHLSLTTEEATERLKGNFTADIAAYEKVHEQILHMADMLSAGIIDQFPQKFR